MDIVNELFSILGKLEIRIIKEDENELLETYITNSYKQVKFIIEVEKLFHIEIPERLMIAVDDITVKQFANEIKNLIG